MNVSWVAGARTPEVYFPTKLCTTVELTLQFLLNAAIRYTVHAVVPIHICQS